MEYETGLLFVLSLEQRHLMAFVRRADYEALFAQLDELVLVGRYVAALGMRVGYLAGVPEIPVYHLAEGDVESLRMCGHEMVQLGMQVRDIIDDRARAYDYFDPFLRPMTPAAVPAWMWQARAHPSLVGLAAEADFASDTVCLVSPFTSGRFVSRRLRERELRAMMEDWSWRTGHG